MVGREELQHMVKYKEEEVVVVVVVIWICVIFLPKYLIQSFIASFLILDYVY
jgi:hypothetical protein